MKKQIIIILEGHDKSGKTSIAKVLSEKIKVPIFKVVRNKYDWDKEANLKYGTEQITQFLQQTGASVILDRWHPSDFMYSKLFGRTVDLKKINGIDRRLSQLDAVIIYCYKHQDNYEVDEEDKDFVNPSMYGKMTSLYQQYASLYSQCRYIFLNTSDKNLDKQLKAIKKLLQ
jgi:thymidylate kinase